MGRRKAPEARGDRARRLFFFVAGSLLVGFLAVFLNAVLGIYMPRHFSISARGRESRWRSPSGCCGCSSNPPLFLRNVPPLAAGVVRRAWACTSRASGSNRKNMAQEFDRRRDRRGPRRLHRRDPRGAAGVQDRVHRGLEEREGRARPGRHLPQRGLHPVQGAAFVLGGIREGRATTSTTHGITVSGVKIDVAKMQARKDAIVTKMTKGVEFLFKKNKITWLPGFGKFVSGGDYLRDRGVDMEAAPSRRSTSSSPPARSARHLPNVDRGQRDRLRQRRRARLPVGAQAPRRDRRRRDRPRARQRAGAAWAPKSRSSKRCRIFSAPATRRSPRKPGSSSPRRRASTSSSA